MADEGGRAAGGGPQGPRVVAVDPAAPDPAAVAAAVGALGAGALVAFPTDTLYALAADPFRAGALARVFAAKGRDAAKAVSLLVIDAGMALRLVSRLPPFVPALMERFWPGPLTLILPPAAGLPAALVPPGGGIGLRAPGGRLSQAILRGLGGPVVGTSANRAGGPDPADADTVLREVGPHLALLLDGGQTPVGAPSTVLDCLSSPPRLLRVGAVSPAAIRDVVSVLLPEEGSPDPCK